MDPVAEDLRLYGAVPDAEPLPWSWVRDQLAAAGTYWVVARARGHPHPRPVWGVWAGDGLRLSVGSPVLERQVAADGAVAVHLDSGTDVVVIEGQATPGTADDTARWVDAYDAKYHYGGGYSVAEYGPFTRIAPTAVMAWRSGGWAGREGFQQVGRWRFA